VKEYRIIGGTWSTLDHNNGEVLVEELEDGVSVSTFSYGIDFVRAEEEKERTMWPLHKLLCDKIKSDAVEMQDDINELRRAGLAPLAPDTVLKDGEIIDKEQYRQGYKARIRERINELHSGYNIENADRNPTYKKNWKRKIDNLINAEEREDYLDIDLSEIEDDETAEVENETA
jgi:hypothetical protein